MLTFCQPTPVDPQTSDNDSSGDPTGLTCSNGCRKWKRLGLQCVHIVQVKIQVRLGLQMCPYSSGENTGKIRITDVSI